MGVTDDLVRNSERYTQQFAGGDLPAEPARKVAVLTCMDARIDPARILGLEEGDAHVIRNAGGVVTDDAIRSLALSQHLLGTEAVVVIQHTACGLLGLDEDEFAERIESETGRRPPWHTRAFEDLEAEVRTSVARISGSVFLPRRDDVRGFVYEVETGRLREVAKR